MGRPWQEDWLSPGVWGLGNIYWDPASHNTTHTHSHTAHTSVPPWQEHYQCRWSCLERMSFQDSHWDPLTPCLYCNGDVLSLHCNLQQRHQNLNPTVFCMTFHFFSFLHSTAQVWLLTADKVKKVVALLTWRGAYLYSSYSGSGDQEDLQEVSESPSQSISQT
jgi:hypothetical protein